MTAERKPNSLPVSNPRCSPVGTRRNANQIIRNGRVVPVTPAANPPLLHLPPHLCEVCTFLAAGLLRLRRRAAEDLACAVAQACDQGESSLHFRGDQSMDANRNNRRRACPA